MSHDHEAPPEPGTIDWKFNGVRVIKGDQLDTNTAQTPGMNRAAAINAARRRSGPARSTSTPTPRPACITTARWKA